MLTPSCMGAKMHGARLLATVGLALSLLTAPPATAQQTDPYAEVVPAFNRGDFETVFALAAGTGDPAAQFMLGLMYEAGRGVLKDDTEAERWYRRSAEQGNADAQFNLGVIYDGGRQGVPYSAAEAIRWYRLAAERGIDAAQNNLGAMYDEGRGVPENDVEAVRWYRLAADQGYAQAQVNLGLMYYQGAGVRRDSGEAIRWFRQAADQNFAQAQFDLGFAYRDGNGAPQNYVEAYKWWSLAAAQGYPNAAQRRDEVAQIMALAQVAEGQRLATAWRPGNRAGTEPKAPHEDAPSAAQIDSTGSGFFITAAGHLLTNAHVVEGCVRVSLTGGHPLTVLDVDLGSDLALLKAASASPRAALMLRQGRGVRLADSVVVAGYPLTGLLSSGLNVTTGAVSALAGPSDDRRLIQITAPVQPGNSGGPLLDTSGNVIGVVVSKLDAVKVASITGDIPQNVNFAISLGTLQAFLDANSIDYQTRASSSPKSNADVAEMARAAIVQIECRN